MKKFYALMVLVLIAGFALPSNVQAAPRVPPPIFGTNDGEAANIILSAKTSAPTKVATAAPTSAAAATKIPPISPTKITTVFSAYGSVTLSTGEVVGFKTNVNAANSSSITVTVEIPYNATVVDEGIYPNQAGITLNIVKGRSARIMVTSLVVNSAPNTMFNLNASCDSIYKSSAWSGAGTPISLLVKTTYPND